MDRRGYYRLWLFTAFKHSIGPPDAIAGAIGVSVSFVLSIFPHLQRWQAVMNDLAWQIPLGTFVALIGARLLLAPYWIHKDQVARTIIVEQERNELQRNLDDKERLSHIRTTLGEFSEEGRALVHKTQNEKEPPPKTEANAWATKVEAFLEAELGPDYVYTFRSHEGLHIGFTYLSSEPHRTLESGLGTRVARLQEFMSQLRMRSIPP